MEKQGPLGDDEYIRGVRQAIVYGRGSSIGYRAGDRLDRSVRGASGDADLVEVPGERVSVADEA